MQKAQKVLRPKLTPKSPLRQSKYDSKLDSPTATSSELSQSTASSISEHGNCNTGFVFEASQLLSFSNKSTTGSKVQFRKNRISLPLLLVGVLTLIIGVSLLRALVTFGTSLLRLFVIFVAIVAFLVFSKQPEQRKKNFKTSSMPSLPPVKEFPTSISSSDNVFSITHSPQSTMAPASETSAYTSHPYGNGYGHARQSTIASSSPSQVYRSTEGRTRQLLQVNSR